MELEGIKLMHEISVTDYNDLRGSVDFVTIRENRAETALANALYKVIAYDGEKPVGMTRVVGDGGYVYFICDVIVRPSYQSKGLGRRLIETTLAWLETQVGPGETIMVNLMSAMGKEKFYEKLGFHTRPFGNHGAGMSRWIEGNR
ncbi:MAG: GNAT family N-acetyltransferase [Eubacterium sp.]|nr:GNAT family N-acetyltransferase [Eubacterium sp.]